MRVAFPPLLIRLFSTESKIQYDVCVSVCVGVLQLSEDHTHYVQKLTDISFHSLKRKGITIKVEITFDIYKQINVQHLVKKCKSMGKKLTVIDITTGTKVECHPIST